jgi:mannitol-specific phosphotransferase system IIBC component
MSCTSCLCITFDEYPCCLFFFASFCIFLSNFVSPVYNIFLFFAFSLLFTLNVAAGWTNANYFQILVYRYVDMIWVVVLYTICYSHIHFRPP